MHGELTLGRSNVLAWDSNFQVWGPEAHWSRHHKVPKTLIQNLQSFRPKDPRVWIYHSQCIYSWPVNHRDAEQAQTAELKDKKRKEKLHNAYTGIQEWHGRESKGMLTIDDEEVLIGMITCRNRKASDAASCSCIAWEAAHADSSPQVPAPYVDLI